MSVLINMEMPKSCRECRFCNGQANTDYGVCAWCNVDGKARDAYTMQDCPLVPVPAHGDLIDRDALELDSQKRLLMCDKNDNQFQRPYEVMRAITLAPTVIPADGKDTDVPTREECE